MMPPPPPPQPNYDPHNLEANGRHLAKQTDKSAGFMVFVNILYFFTQFFLGAVVFSAFFYATSLRNYTVVIGIWEVLIQNPALSTHIYLCVIGYFILMSQAMLAFNPYVGWGSYLQESHRRIVHSVMQVTGSALAIAGSIIKIVDSNINFNSAHAIVGLTAMILTIISLVGGVLNMCMSRNGNKISVINLCHTCLASLTISAAFIALCIAFHDYFKMIYHDDVANLSIAFSVFAGVGLLSLVYLKYL